MFVFPPSKNKMYLSFSVYVNSTILNVCNLNNKIILILIVYYQYILHIPDVFPFTFLIDTANYSGTNAIHFIIRYTEASLTPFTKGKVP